jgi:hypothetical protein
MLSHIYTLLIQLKSNQIKIILYQNKKEIKTVFWEDKLDLDTQLLKKLDKFLKMNKIRIVDIKKVEFAAKEDVGVTAKNIVQATVESLNFALNKAKAC